MNKNTLQKFIIAAFISIFLVLYLLFLITFYLIPNNYLDKISLFLFLGFVTIIICFFLFITLNPNKENDQLIGFKFLSENLIKIILAISTSVAFFIPPVTFTTTIMDWSQIGITNYIRAVVFIVGCAFLPGACAFNVMFPKSELHKKFKVESFVLKITFYPIFSFVLIGISVLILDAIGLIREFFPVVLLLIILTLFISDLLVQFFREKNNLKNYFQEIIVSKHTFYVLIIALGYSLFTIGVQITMRYLIPGDAWAGLRSANFIGNPNVHPSWDVKLSGYPNFWGYIIFGLGNLCGIPYININVLLTPFSYLSVTSMYLFIKSILSKYKDMYAVLATILVSLFAGIFFLTCNELGLINITIGGKIPTSLRYALDHKNFAYILYNFSMGLFTISLKIDNLEKRKFFISSEEFKILFLSALFILTSYMTYLIQFIAGIYIPFLYCLFSEKGFKKQKLPFFTTFLFLFISLFMIFDRLSEFSLSLFFYIQFSRYILIIKRVAFFLVVYGILWGVFMIFIIFQILYSKFFFKIKTRKNLKFNINPKFIFLLIIAVFTGLIAFEIYNINKSDYISKLIYDSNRDWYYLICLYLNLTLVRIGIIGIAGIYLSYFCFKTNRNLFYFLTSWIICALIVSSIMFFTIYANPDNSISGDDYYVSNFWIARNWVYSFPAFSILASIGVINLEKALKNLKFKNRTLKSKNRNLNLILKLSLASILIFSSYSSIIVEGMHYNSSRRMDDAEAQVVGWITREIPLGSSILGERSYEIERSLFLLTEGECNYYYMKSLFESTSPYESQLNELKKKNIQYVIFYKNKHLDMDSEQEDFVDDFLIPKIYYKKLYEYKELVVYYAPNLEDDVDKELDEYEEETSSFNNAEVGAEQMDCYVSIDTFNISIDAYYSNSSYAKDLFCYKNATQICNYNNLIYTQTAYSLKKDLL